MTEDAGDRPAASAGNGRVAAAAGDQVLTAGAPGAAAPGDAAPGDAGPGDAAPGDGEPADRAAAAGPDAPSSRVEFRALEAALIRLRGPVDAAALPLEVPGAGEARAERARLLSQIDDYLLPRLRQSGAPVLVALAGSTGAGKSTLINSIVGTRVSATGVRRPTTSSPVLACHPGDVHWFAENVFLPALPRVRQQGLAMPGRDGLLVLAPSDGMPPGVAILDTPDIDSVIESHRQFARQFLDACDLWLLVTTARRYADAAVWNVLTEARDRGAALAVAMSRVPPGSEFETGAHLDAMLEANGLGGVRRFVIPETEITGSMLPAGMAGPVVDWLTDTARQADRRVAVLTQTMTGVLDTFRSRVPALADQITAQREQRQRLRAAVHGAFGAARAQLDAALASGSLLQGELLARWQDLAAGDLLLPAAPRRFGGRGRSASHSRERGPMPERAVALQQALQTCLEAVVVATAGRAAEDVLTAWREQPGGAQLLDGEAGPLRPADGLAGAAASQITLWQENLRRLVRAENADRPTAGRVVLPDDETLALVLAVGVLAAEAGDGQAGEEQDGALDPGAAAVQLLGELLGAGLLRDLSDRVRQDLRERAGTIYEAQAQALLETIDSAGLPGERAAAELLQAGFAVEEAR